MGGSSTNTTETAVAGIQVQTSLLGQSIPVGWGRGRLSCNLIDYVGFAATPHTTKSGGKGMGGGSSSNTTYSYSASIIMALCEGPVIGVRNVYRDSSVLSMANAGLSLALGAQTQTPWPYMTSMFPSHAIGYSNLCYVYAQDYALGSGAQLSNHSFEVDFATQFGPDGDADPRDIAVDFLTNVSYGVTGWGSGLISDLSDYSNYCKASNLLLSPVLDSSTSGADFLKRISDQSNSEFYWSEGVIKAKPYGDKAVSGNGVTWVPNLTPIYDLDESDFLEEVQLEIIDQSDAYNYVQIEYLDRSNQYQPAVAIAQDMNNIINFGLRKRDAEQFHDVCDADVAQKLVQLRLQRSLYIRDIYHFVLPEDFAALEPMDYVTLSTTTDSMSLSRKLVLIKQIEESEDGVLTITAEGVPGSASAALYTAHTSGGYQPQVDAAPGPVNNPSIFVPPPGILTVDGEIWVAASGLSQNWGGCQVWISADGSSYQNVGDLTNPSRYGSLQSSLPLTADPDNTNTLSVDLSMSRGSLLSGTSAEMNNGATLALIDNELVSYQNATLTGANRYNLAPLRRGLFGTSPAFHASGAKFTRLDDSIFKFSYKGLNVGNTFYVKLVSFNIYGRALEDLSTVAVYNVTLSGLPQIIANSVDDGSVTTPSIVGGAVSSATRVVPGGSTSGSGSFIQVATMSVSLSYGAQIDINSSAIQAYSSGVKDWGYRIKVDGSIVKELPFGSGRVGYSEAVVIQRDGVSLSAGSHTVTVEWCAADSTVALSGVELSVIRRFV